MCCSCPLPTARFWVWVSLYPAISKNLKAFLYGWLPLSNAYGIPSLATQHKSNTNSISFHCSTTQNLSPFRGSVNGCVLSRGSVLHTSPPACILSCIPTKSCRGKCMKEKLNCVKTTSSLFIHHSSFRESLAFTAPNISFDRAKGHVLPHQTLPFTRRNMVFRAAKPYLSQIQIL